MAGASSSIQFQIPPRLKDKLGQGPLGAEVRAALHRFHEWIGDPRLQLFFFPEYTDHGPEHVNRVLASVEWLITEESWPLLSEEDAAVLCLATLLHDAAMHLPGDGFVALLKQEDRPRIQLFDTKSWSQLFEDFCAEAKRWDDRKLYGVFGDRTKGPKERAPATIIAEIRERVYDPERLDLGDRKLVGELLRRHHARLAHEIALFGVPAPAQATGTLNLASVRADLPDLAGLVARSHNFPLRETFEYLKTKYSARVTCLKTHPIFLMVLLRIADYLEMDASRVNETASKLHALRSPTSQREWDAHLAVREVRMPDEGDADGAFVFAIPESSGTFLKLQSLLEGLQKELDTSWAVLGEVFSRQGDLRKLGLRLRRVRSNLDDPKAFLRDQNPAYFPIRAAFETAGADLLKLLIKPLYGDYPEVGVRELLQNSVDAVWEIEKVMADRGDPEMQSIVRRELDCDVLIEIDAEDGDLHCTVSDRGIGMTAETVRDYFLKAGASFRTSDAWLKQFAPDGTPTVPRTGRFGIGALAAFLMGDRIEVWSRHLDARPEDGAYFSASLADGLVSLERRMILAVGTCVRVRLNGKAGRLEYWSENYCKSWDWFVLAKPVVRRKLQGRELSPARALSGEFGAALAESRQAVAVDGLRFLGWGLDERWNREPSSCNGIPVRHPQESMTSRFFWEDRTIPFGFPRVDLVEGGQQVPLILNRYDFEEPSFFFSGPLLEAVTADFCAFLLALAPKDAVGVLRLQHLGMIKNSVSAFEGRRFAPFLCLPEGFTLLDPWHAHVASGRVVRLVESTVFDCGELREGLLLTEAPISSFDDLDINRPEIGPPALHNLEASLRLWSTDDLRFFGNPDKRSGGMVFSHRKRSLRLRSWSRGHLPETPADLLAACWQTLLSISAGKARIPEVVLLEILVGEIPRIEASTPFSKIWSDLLGDVVIPYGLAERKRRFPRAFEILREKIELWRSPKLSGWRLDVRNEAKWLSREGRPPGEG